MFVVPVRVLSDVHDSRKYGKVIVYKILCDVATLVVPPLLMIFSLVLFKLLVDLLKENRSYLPLFSIDYQRNSIYNSSASQSFLV